MYLEAKPPVAAMAGFFLVAAAAGGFLLPAPKSERVDDLAQNVKHMKQPPMQTSWANSGNLASRTPAPISRHLFLATLSIIVSMSQATAHPGHPIANGFTEGLAHPVSGLDHLLAMVAVGLWAVQLGGKAKWVVPSVFVLLMTVGAVLGFEGIRLPFAEVGILASVLILGLLLLTASRWSLPVSAVLVGTFAICHGHAHGTELSTQFSGVSYGLGFVIATAALHFGGILLGNCAQRHAQMGLLRYAGAAVVLAGLWLTVS